MTAESFQTNKQTAPQSLNEGHWEPVCCLRDIQELRKGDLIKTIAPYGYKLLARGFDFYSSNCTRRGGVVLKKSEEWCGVVNDVSVDGMVGGVDGLITNGEDTVECRLSSESFAVNLLRLYRWEPSS